VVRGVVPDYSVAVGAPAKVVKNRQLAWETSAAQRAELDAALADIERKKAAGSPEAIRRPPDGAS
jgi:serine acetyltransferase